MPQTMGPDAHKHQRATFPPMDNIPEAARPQVLAFLLLRRRLNEAQQAYRDALAQLEPAIAKDRSDLADIVLEGGTSATFGYPATAEAKKAIEHARADLDVLKEHIGSVYVSAVYAVQRVAEEGAADADTDIVSATADYLVAIDNVENARRAYLNALGLRYFWDHLTERGEAFASAGNGDQFVLKRGPITRVDSHTFKALRSDAQAHTRLDGAQDSYSTW